MYFLKGNFNKDKLGWVLFILGFLFLIITSYIGLTKLGVWYDEIYSIAFVQLPFEEMLNLGLQDVHPLLYYLIFKVFFKLFTLVGFTNVIVIGKIVSLIPFYLLGALILFKVRKNWGMLTAGLFFLCLCSMPQLMIYAVEIRMYSWGLFFVTASFIYAYEIIKEPSFRNWTVLTILTICSAYTHYFSAIASFVIYLILLFYIIRYNKELFKKWFISALIAVLAFLPWIFVVFNQISTISNNYWIDPISLNTVISCFYYVLSPANIFIQANELLAPTILGSIFILIFIVLFFKQRNKFAFMGLLTFMAVPAIGIVISLLVDPFFHQRYMIPALGCLWLAFSIVLSKFYSNKKIFIPVLCFILLIGVIGTVDFINMQNADDINTKEDCTNLNNLIGSGNIIFNDFFPTYFEFCYFYSPDNHHLCWSEDIINNIELALEDPGIKNEINRGSKVFYIDGGNSNLEELENSNLTFTEVPFKTTLKDNEFNIYELHVN